MSAGATSASLWRRRSPPAGWEGYFFIGIFPRSVAGDDSAPLLWCKVHLFSGGKSPEKHCLSALEGLDGGPRELLLLGRSSGVERVGGDIPATRIATDRLDARGREVSFVADGERSLVRAAGFEASIVPRDPLFWIRAPRVLTYFSASGEVRVRTKDGEVHTGFGLLEHAWGAQTRLDVARLAPRRWHWDVLWLGGDRFFAGLNLHGRGMHGGARTGEGRPPARVSRSSVRIQEAHGDSPGRWEGVMATREGTLRYEARATTDMAREVEGGGFLGFSWQGTLDGEPVSGSGFCEQRGAGR